MTFKKPTSTDTPSDASVAVSGVPLGTSIRSSTPEVSDAVDHPKHYNSHPSGIECIEVIRHMPHNIGAAMKYLWRAGLKDGAPTEQDYEKAIWYIRDQIKLEREKANAAQ